ncbi:linear gramicidin synthase subunit d [Trichoderma cornu-damae]|uniref:Linear gramicidin synthase subunit d n=1 Tax=Trichoderma cornu-damae TaxID=654480 RepID=A0A9P8QIB5_9HYPO|nr:linear gramicidin synthase subunit d [Trichoderma cornu-damae]
MSVIDTAKDLAALFEQQAQATPDAIALEDENRTLTYAELDSLTWSLADRLRQYGVGRDDLVGVLMGRSADNVMASLAALRAGGAFLVLELAYPTSLLQDVIDDARPTVIITQKAHAANIKADVPTIVVDQPEPTPNGHAAPIVVETREPLPASDDLDRLAFVSYSSGTTGKPKGIANPHRAPVLSYDLRFRLSDLGPGDRVACNVFFVWEMLRPLIRGATTVAVPDVASYDPIALVEFLAARRITDTLMTPTLLTTVLSRHPNLGKKLPELRSLWLNGEVVTTDLVRRACSALPNTRLLNVYSASETHEIAVGDVKTFVDYEARVCPVGPPVDPDHIYILDEAGNRLEVGASGELFVGGDLLAREYLNLPETTAAAFQADPFENKEGARMYRTGDMARMLPSGLLEITGRVGGMIKTRGYTVQPGAVETTIVKHLAVRDCAVVAHGEGLQKQLVAYIVPDDDNVRGRTIVVVDESGHSPVARRALSTHLAHYMIPPLWVELKELPTHAVSGKTNPKALPPPPTRPKTPADTAKAERNVTVKMDTIIKMWSAALNVPVPSITPKHDFFDLGGHSLTLADLASRLTKAFGFPVPLAPLAGTPTLEGHLDAVKAARDGHTEEVQADLPAVLRADAVLPEDIHAADAQMRRLSDAETVLLTGSTGYLGGFLLKYLLENTSAQILCMVRFTEPTEDCRPAGMARIRKNLIDLGIWSDSMLVRMEVVPGNLTRSRLGLSPEAFEELASRVQVIVHSAATVNLVYPYAALRSANVNGTREIIRLASRGGATLHHISTNGVLPPSLEGWSEDAMIDFDDVPDKLQDGYGQTKWVAEKLVIEASKRGLPARIYRPGTISGHSDTGAANTYDLVNALIVESLQLGQAPDIPDWVVEMTPVDFVSKAIIALADHAQSQQLVYHIGDPSPIRASSLFDSLAEIGYDTGRLPWDDWVDLWNEKRGARGGDEPFTVDILRGGMPTVDTLKGAIVLKDGATRPTLDLYGLKRIGIDSVLLETYTRHFYARGWLPRPPRRLGVNGAAPGAKKGRLAGKVAIITGASSGIGAAVAAGLAREGASVALAARRADVLESVKARISRGSGSKVLVRQTDVASKDQVDSLVREATERLGPVDIIVCCAGVMYYTMMANVQMDQWERTVDVNCKGVLNCIAATVPGMLDRKSGHVVAISSDAGRKVFPGLGVYSASKFFVEAALQSLRVETAGSGLRVTSIQPGNTATDLLGMSTDAEAVKKYGEPSGAKILDPEDVASSIVYALCQPEHVAVNEILIEPRDEPI